MNIVVMGADRLFEVVVIGDPALFQHGTSGAHAPDKRHRMADEDRPRMLHPFLEQEFAFLAESGIADAKTFIDKAKASSVGINYASAGAGSPHHLAMELLKVETGLRRRFPRGIPDEVRKQAEFETFMRVISPWEREYLLLNV